MNTPSLFQDLVREKTGQEKMQFIGFGMGVTAFVVTANELPEYVAEHVKMAHFMAPATYLKHIETPLAQMGGRFVGQLTVRILDLINATYIEIHYRSFIR